MQGINWWSQPKSWGISNRISKNNRLVIRREKNSSTEAIIITKSVWNILKRMVRENKENRKNEIVRNVWTSCGSWK